ncbi:MAG: hypothetical protein JRN39_02435 [Nitrososphaerota archaeon]|nr:hypothetical protein [Nitrososphaerota archaeon]
MPDQLFIANAVLSLASGLVALLVSYTAFKHNRLVESGILRFVSFGFMLLGMGLLLQGSLITLLALDVGRIADRAALVYVASLIYLVLQLVAYSAFAVGYARGAYGRKALAFLSVVVVSKSELLLGTYVNAVTQLGSVMLLGFVVFQGILVYTRTRNRVSLLVLMGFALILVAHSLTMLASVLVSGLLYLAAGSVQFAGFLALLLFLIRSGHIGSATEEQK